MLFHISDAGIFGAHDFSGIVGHFAGNHTEKSGFAAAVIADKTDFVTVADVKGNIAE